MYGDYEDRWEQGIERMSKPTISNCYTRMNYKIFLYMDKMAENRGLKE